MDKAFWERIRNNQYQLPAEPPLDQLTSVLMGYLLSPDPELRDRYGYFILGTWIERGYYSEPQMVAMADHVAAHLRMGLGEPESDWVYLRSFAALILCELIGRDMEAPYLTAEQFAGYARGALAWFEAEVDLRGFDSKKGWAHAGAHGADLLKVIARHPRTDVDGLRDVLSAIAGKVAGLHGQVFLFDEDERLVSAVLAAFDRGLLDETDAAAFTTHLAEQAERWWRGRLEPAEVVARQNTRNFLRSLFLRLLEQAEPTPWLLEAVRTATVRRLA